MKKSIKYILLFVFITLFMMIDIEAKEPIETCYYNLTGVAETGNKANDAYVTVYIYDDMTVSGTINYKKIDEATYSEYSKEYGDTFDAKIMNWADVRVEYEKSKECLGFITYSGYFSDRINLYTYKDVNENFSIKDKWWNEPLTQEPILMALINSEDNKTATTCQYEGFNIEKNAAGGIIRIDSGTTKLLPSVDMILNPSSYGCQSVYYCINYDMSLIVDAHLFYTADGINLHDIKQKDCTLIKAKENAYEGAVCSKYTNLYSGDASNNIIGLKDYANEYNTCKKNNDAACISESIGNYNAQKSKIVDWCNSILSNQNYNDGCLQQCLKLSDEILTLEKDMKIAITQGEDACSLGDSIILWIGNVIRWMKYIVPVIVIVFGMLDFIKATGADKEDEIKKAQGAFVKRLIAAALVFIIPFIIGFVLKIFNFDANGCGIIKL